MSANSLNIKGSSKKKIWILSTIAVIVVIVLAVFGSSYYHKLQRSLSRSKANNTTKQFTASLTAGDLEKSYALTSKNFQSKNTKEDFKKLFSDLKTSTHQAKDTELTTGSNTASFNGQLTGLNFATRKDKTTAALHLDLVKKSGKWAIDSISVF